MHEPMAVTLRNFGITIDDMEPEWGRVETNTYEATQNDIDAELEFWKVFAAKRQMEPRRI